MAISSHKGKWVTLAIVTGILVWNYNRPEQTPVREIEKPVPKVVASPPPSPVEPPPPYTSKVLDPPVVLAPPLHPIPATPSPPAAQVLPGSVAGIPATAEDISEDLNAVDAAIRNFEAVLGENPIGSNAEITAALLGNNLKQIKLELPTGSRLNGEGEMCDRWGTPYFFHQVSKTEMEIRSAGPDRQMWTGDDSQIK